MKTTYRIASALLVALPLFFATSCGNGAEQKKTPNSEMNGATPEKGEESNAALGVGEGNQDERGEYPKNQANLYPDTTRKDSVRRY